MVKVNALFLSAFLVAFFLYSGLCPLKEKNPYQSLLPLESVTTIECTVISNPVKFSVNNYYSCTADIFSAGTQNVDCEARGRILLFLPATVVESLFPGRLNSLGTASLLVEEGGHFSFTGSWNSRMQAFEVSCGECLGWGNGRSQAYGLSGSLLYLRARLRLVFKRMLYSWGKAGALILALLSGSREYLDPVISDSFKRAGLSHILALSGMHLSFFSSLLGKSSAKAFGKKWSLFPQLSGTILFVFFAGFTPSLFRAFLFFLIIFFCHSLFVTETDNRRVLAAVFLLHAAIRPQDVFTPAFMLSYGATGGILFLGSFFTHFTNRFLPHRISSSFATSLSAQAATLPVSILLFGSFYPVGLISTLVVSPIISFFMVISFASVLLCTAVPFLSPAFGAILNLNYTVIDVCVRFFARFPSVTFWS